MGGSTLKIYVTMH